MKNYVINHIYFLNQMENCAIIIIKQEIICNYNNHRKKIDVKLYRSFQQCINPVGWEFTNAMGDFH